MTARTDGLGAAMDAHPPRPVALVGRTRAEAAAPNQATRLRALAEEDYDLYRAADDGEPVAIARGGPNLALPLRGGRSSLRAALADRFARETGRVPTGQASADALLALEGAAQGRPRVPVHLRAAKTGDGIVLDMGDEAGRAIEVGPTGWRTIGRSPVTFRRSELTDRLPDPAPGGRGVLGSLLNVADHELPLVRAFLLAPLFDVPTPILLLRGPAGAAKTTAARILASLVDPTSAPVRSAPRDDQAWAVTAAGSRFVAIDNLETFPRWLSDALCRAVTGDALVRRALYTDSALSVLRFRRAIILTSIDPGAMRGDLADRILAVDLEQIPETRRLDDAAIADRFADLHPAILGDLLDLLAAVLDALPSTHLERRPRMADYARVLAAVDAVEGTDGLARYLDQRGQLQREVAQDDPVGLRIDRVLMNGRPEWEGTATDLHDELSPIDTRTWPKGWPPDPRTLAQRVRRLVAPLAALGIAVTFEMRGRGNDRERIVRFARAMEGGE